MMDQAFQVELWIDGAYSGNPGPGGWDAILDFGGARKELKGGKNPTTNNRMELLAAIVALETLEQACDVILHADSKYVKNGITNWIRLWKKNGWRTVNKKPIKNEDLWKRLDAAASRRKVQRRWVKGHAGIEMNERADELAREGLAQAR